MEHLRPPEPLRLTADGGRNWKRFRQQFEFFLQATACKSNPRSEAAKTAVLLSVAGDEALDVFNNFVFSGEENKEDFNTVIAKFEDYCLEQQNEVHERYVFRSRSQGEAEPFELFLRELRKQAQHCNFGTMADDMGSQTNNRQSNARPSATPRPRCQRNLSGLCQVPLTSVPPSLV
ncbi:hypothetical protein HPB52_013895 [Rhipicephalus sanguineus]|uniref:Tick transposon n=1 Tax=Rhipicephalus sanguineus TaxID=34632 RepID=A0A9D4PEF6_RHISA|nr:hypothetical protein HPB52_013895 [Rhipicephalus sanguineus]